MKISSSTDLIDLVHGSLAELATTCPDHVAIADEISGLTFAGLHEAVLLRSATLVAEQAPSIVFVDISKSVPQRLVDFFGIVHSGRCAAVGDPGWPVSLRRQLESALLGEASGLTHAIPASDFYIGFTSGSTGIPKGFMRDHRSWTESFRVCLQTFGPAAAGRVFAPGGVSHSLFLFGMLLGVWSGGGVIVQSQFSAGRAIETLAHGQAETLVAVPSQLVMMLEHVHRRGLSSIDTVRLVMISGARWTRQRTPELRALFPQARIIEFYGASETSFMTWMEADENTPDIVVGKPFDGVDIEIRHQGQKEKAGLIFVRSRMLFNRYAGQSIDPTAAIRDDNGWLSVRDMGYIDEEGRLCLVGRENRMIVTAGKNLFPEEIEVCLGSFPGVGAVSVQGLPDAVRGLSVLAWIHPAPGIADESLSPAELTAWCRDRLEPYKMPRQFRILRDWPLTAGGKTDHATLAALTLSLGELGT